MPDRQLQKPETVRTGAESETREYGRSLGATLTPGDVVCISGRLGAGKTVLCRGIAEGLGVDPELVSSPSFAIVNEYRGRCDVLHLDFYRLSGAEELERIGWSDYLERDAVMLIEWPEIAEAALPAKRINITITHPDSTDDGSSSALREITILRESGDSND